METKMQYDVLKEGISVIFKELGPIKAIEFFQKLGLNRGDSVKELRAIRERRSKKDILDRIRKMRNDPNSLLSRAQNSKNGAKPNGSSPRNLKQP